MDWNQKGQTPTFQTIRQWPTFELRRDWTSPPALHPQPQKTEETEENSKVPPVSVQNPSPTGLAYLMGYGEQNWLR